MGKRVNLAELAREEVPDTYSPRSAGTLSTTEIAATDAADAVRANATGPETPYLPLAEIAPNPLNRRADADLSGEDFDQLTETIRAHGVLQPIVVCTSDAFLQQYPTEAGQVQSARWVALIGNRRLLAASHAGLEFVPALVNDDRAASMYEVMLVENSHRRDLDVLHEAEAMQQVLEQDRCSRRELASRIGRTHTYVNQRLALLGLIPSLRAALRDGHLTVEAAREFGGLPVAEQEAIADAGRPHRRRPARPAGNVVSTPARRRSITVATPAKAAESIRRLFTPAERAELVRLLAENDES